MKRLKIISIMLLIITLVSCDVDPYENQRPVDFEDSKWLCEGENYRIYFESGKLEESVFYVEGNEEIHFEFLWNAFYAHVILYEYGTQNSPESQLLSGSCEFGRKKFVINVSNKAEDLEALPDTLVFERID